MLFEMKNSKLTGKSRLEIITCDSSIQNLLPTNDNQRFEGIRFSASGNILGVVTSDTNCIFLFRRRPDGLFENTPYLNIHGPGSRLDYPHDLSFLLSGKTELLAVAQRSGSIVIYRNNHTSDDFGIEPVFEIAGRDSGLDYSDGVSFVPPNGDYLAVCNLKKNNVTFYRKKNDSSCNYELNPAFVLEHKCINEPDGLAFSQSGEWLALANHGNNTATVFQRCKSANPKYKIKYGPDPVTVIRDPNLHYPHSVAFTPGTDHLVVTNAGANYFSIYQPFQRRKWYGVSVTDWSQSPVQQIIVGTEDKFRDINVTNKQEGGPKGVAIHKNNLAICSPVHGVKVYSFREFSL